MKIGFGAHKEGIPYRVLNERVVRANAGIMFLLILVTYIKGILFGATEIIPYTAGFLLLNFTVGVLISPRYSPTTWLAKLIVRKQEPIFIGAVQKRFAWSLGMAMTTITFALSLNLQNNPGLLTAVCVLCTICMALMFLETAFGICLGCKIYFGAIKIGLIKKPKHDERPNCTGNTCATHE